MSNTWDTAVKAASKNQAEGMQQLDKLFAVTQPGAVYSEPIYAEGQTVITLSEIRVAMGFGYGIAEGGGPEAAEGKEPQATAEGDAKQAPGGGGGGGGGGGFSVGRPIAVVNISADGVQVKPVVDVTRLGLAALTAFGAMALMWARMSRMSRRR